jgi:hypothetical protein
MPAHADKPASAATVTPPEARLPEDLLRQASGRRVEPVEYGGRRYWIKRREALTGRMRLQKGNPAKAFERERAALRLLAERQLPVAPVVAEGPDFFATPDVGPSLLKLIRNPAIGPSERCAAFAAAGSALAAFHVAGLAHGSPSIRDFCWSQGHMTVIDLERFDPRRNGLARQRNDFLMLVFSALAELRGPAPEIDALDEAYRAAAPPAVPAAAEQLCRRLRWIEPLTRPLQRRDRRKGEFRAIPHLLRHFRGS